MPLYKKYSDHKTKAQRLEETRAELESIYRRNKEEGKSINIYLNKHCHTIRNTVTRRLKPRDWKELGEKFREYTEGSKKKEQVSTYILINIATLQEIQ